MEINRHIGFRIDEDCEFVSYLRENNIKHKESASLVVLDIYESDPHWDNVYAFVKKLHIPAAANTVFTKEELDSAEWLRVWSQWRFDYPQPMGTFMTKQFTYSYENKCPECGIGDTQIAPFRIKKAPEWKKRNFCELNWIGDELFVSGKAKNILENADITGITFREVLNKNGTAALEDVYQLVVLHILAPDLIESQMDIKAINHCPHCGKTKYCFSGRGMHIHKKESFESVPMVVKSGEFFGAMHYAVRTTIVHNSVYRLIVDNELDKNLVFEPILLV